jgi:hypothetical protein
MIMGPAIAGAGLEPTPAMTPSPAAAPQPQPARRDGPRFDKATLGAAVAAGLISKEAAELLGDDPRKKWRESYDAEEAKNIVKDFNELRDSGRKAANQIANYDVIEALVRNPALLQGPGAERISVPLRRAAEFFGIKTEGLAPTQVFQSLVNEMALQARNPAGGAGMPGAMSDPDREFLRTMVPGLANTPEGNLLLVQIRKRIAQRELDISRMAINYAKNNEGRLDLRFYDLLSQWSERNPIFSEKERSALSGIAPPQAQPERPAAPGATAEDFARMPVGAIVNRPGPAGEMMPFRKVAPGQWAPADAAADAQPPQPRPSETPIERAQRRRQEKAQEPARREAETKATQDAFDAEREAMSPIEFAAKYDPLRFQLRQDQLAVLNQMIADLVPAR